MIPIARQELPIRKLIFIKNIIREPYLHLANSSPRLNNCVPNTDIGVVSHTATIRHPSYMRFKS